MSDNGKTNLHEGHRARMRERFRKSGLDDFEPHQIIELLLFYACPRRDTNELAHRLINKFGSVAGIFDAGIDDLMSVKGVTEPCAVLFKLIPACLSVYGREGTDKLECNSTEKLKELFRPYFVGVQKEEFRLACFDNNLRVVSNVKISSGGPSSAPVEMRRIVEEVIAANSAYAAISHNHPKGIPSPSEADVCVTRLISSTLRSMGVELLDHIIVGERSVVSMRDMAYMNVFD